MRSIEETVNRIKLQAQKAAVGYTPNYKCLLCKDTGIILRSPTGKEVAGSDIPHSQQSKYTSIICTCQSEERIRKCITRSGIDENEYRSKTFDSFIAETDEQIKMKQIAENFCRDENATGFGLFGKSGTGKTHMCIAVLNEFCKKGVSHLYFAYRKEIQELVAFSKYDNESYNKALGRWINVPILYIDDLFKFIGDDKNSREELKIMFALIDARYINKKKTLFSSEFTGKELLAIDEALGSRIIKMCKEYSMKCTGENKRIRE